MTAGKTAVYISHRMSSCKFCDRIIVLDHGRIAEDGTHDTLLANHGIYANLLRNPGPILHLSPHPPVPPQRKWESEKHNPLAVRAKNFQGLCFSGSPPLISGMQTAPHHE